MLELNELQLMNPAAHEPYKPTSEIHKTNAQIVKWNPNVKILVVIF